MEGAVVLALALLALSLAGSSSPTRRRDAAIRSAPDPIATGLEDDTAWLRSRLAVARATAPATVLDAAGFTDGILGWVLAHWALETGWGQNEWNFNVGNLKTGAWRGPVHRLRDRRGNFALYRSYSSLEEGATDYWRLISQGRYLASWQKLLAGDGPGWYRSLLSAGYTEGDPETLVQELGGVKRRADRLLAVPT